MSEESSGLQTILLGKQASVNDGSQKNGSKGLIAALWSHDEVLLALLVLDDGTCIRAFAEHLKVVR